MDKTCEVPVFGRKNELCGASAIATVQLRGSKNKKFVCEDCLTEGYSGRSAIKIEYIGLKGK